MSGSMYTGSALISPDFVLSHYVNLPVTYVDLIGGTAVVLPFSFIYRPHFHISGSHMR